MIRINREMEAVQKAKKRLVEDLIASFDNSQGRRDEFNMLCLKSNLAEAVWRDALRLAETGFRLRELHGEEIRRAALDLMGKGRARGGGMSPGAEILRLEPG